MLVTGLAACTAAHVWLIGAGGVMAEYTLEADDDGTLELLAVWPLPGDVAVEVRETVEGRALLAHSSFAVR